MWYKLSQMAKRLRSDINDRFGRALMEARKAANSGTAYSTKNIDKKSREMYNKWRWATDNNVLSVPQMNQLWSRFEKAISGQEYRTETINGEYLIPLENDPRLGNDAIENVVAYVTDNGDKTLTLNAISA